MTRVGYDADTQTYTYFDPSDNSYWEGEEGNQYGTLHRTTGPNQPLPPSSSFEGVSKRAQYEDWRYLAPFGVIVVVVLLALFKFLNVASAPATLPQCAGEGVEAYRIQRGDTCWELARGRGATVEEVEVANPGLECEALIPGTGICLPVSASKENELESEGETQDGDDSGPPRMQCHMITCVKDFGGDEACKAEGCGKGCSAGGKCIS